jgi:hypothetical protein
MRWVGVAIAILGVFTLLLTITYQSTVESESTMIQRVRGRELVGQPVRAILTSESKVVKGTGPNKSKFVEIDSKYLVLDDTRPVFGLAKAGSFALMAIGVAGYMFETWRIRTRTILKGIAPDKLVDLS